MRAGWFTPEGGTSPAVCDVGSLALPTTIVCVGTTEALMSALVAPRFGLTAASTFAAAYQQRDRQLLINFNYYCRVDIQHMKTGDTVIKFYEMCISYDSHKSRFKNLTHSQLTTEGPTAEWAAPTAAAAAMAFLAPSG